MPDNAIPLGFSVPSAGAVERGTAGYGGAHSAINLAGTREAAVAAAAAGSVSGASPQAADYTAASLPHTPSAHTAALESG